MKDIFRNFSNVPTFYTLNKEEAVKKGGGHGAFILVTHSEISTRLYAKNREWQFHKCDWPLMLARPRWYLIGVELVALTLQFPRTIRKSQTKPQSMKRLG